MAFVQKKNLDHNNSWGAPATPHPSYTVPSDGNVQNTIRMEMSKDGIVYVNAYDNGSSPSDILNPFTEIASRNSGLGQSSDFGNAVKIYNEKIFVGDRSAVDSNRTTYNGNAGGRVFVYNFDGDLIDSIRAPAGNSYNFGFDIKVTGSLLLIASRSSITGFKYWQYNAETLEYAHNPSLYYHGGLSEVHPNQRGGLHAKNGRVVKAGVDDDEYDTFLNIYDHDGRTLNAMQHHHYAELLDSTLVRFQPTYGSRGAPLSGKFAVGDGLIVNLTWAYSDDYYNDYTSPATSKILGTVFDLNGGFKFFLNTPDSDTYGPMFVDNRNDEYGSGAGGLKHQVGIGGGRIAVPVTDVPEEAAYVEPYQKKVVLYDYSGNLINVLHSRPHSDTSKLYDSDGMYFGEQGVIIADDRILVLSGQYDGGNEFNLIHHYTLDGDYIFTDSDIDRGQYDNTDVGIDAREGKIVVASEDNKLYMTDMPRKRISVMDALDMY